MAAARKPVTDKTLDATHVIHAVRADATGETIPVAYGGQTYQIPPPMEWKLTILEHVEEGEIVAAVKLVLGPEQYESFRATDPRVKDIGALFEAIQSAAGLGN